MMNIRTCPHCDYKYSIREYVKKILFKFVYSEWDCQNCSKKITFDFNRRLWVAMGFGCLYILLFFLISIIKNNIGMNLITWILLLAGYITGSIFIFTFDTFKKTE
jgi:CXXC-20-CXXC protein